MLIILAAAASLVLWVLLWGLGWKGLDALMLSVLIMLLAGIVHMAIPILPGRRRPAETDPDPAPFT